MGCRRIETERLVIRWATPADAPGYLDTIDEDVAKANGWSAADLQAVSKFVTTRAFRVLALITDRYSGGILGSIGPDRLDAEQRTCEIGWWLGAPHRGKGYGTEAVGAIIAALHSGGVRTVVVGTEPTNQPVMRVMEKLGGRYTGKTLHQLPNGKLVSSMWFAYDA